MLLPTVVPKGGVQIPVTINALRDRIMPQQAKHQRGNADGQVYGFADENRGNQINQATVREQRLAQVNVLFFFKVVLRVFAWAILYLFVYVPEGFCSCLRLMRCLYVWSGSTDRSRWVLMPKLRIKDSYNIPFAKLESDLLQNVNAQSQLAQQANTQSEYYYELASALELVTALCLTVSGLLSNLIFGWPGDGRWLLAPCSQANRIETEPSVAYCRWGLWWHWTCDQVDHAPGRRATAGFWNQANDGGINFNFQMETAAWPDHDQGAVLVKRYY